MPRDGRALSHEALAELRLRAADLFEREVPVERIAEGMGMKRSTVFGWTKAWKAGGRGALAAKPVPGRPATLSDAQLAELACCVRENAPAGFGFEQALWFRELIAGLAIGSSSADIRAQATLTLTGTERTVGRDLRLTTGVHIDDSEHLSLRRAGRACTPRRRRRPGRARRAWRRCAAGASSPWPR
jgi:transposase